MGIKTAIVSAIAKAAINSIFPDYMCGNNKVYLGVQAHPDDEVLISAVCGRIIAHSPQSRFVSLTNGDRNTDRDRSLELNSAFRLLGYRPEVPCLESEKTLLDLLCTHQGTPTEVPEEKIDAAAQIIGTHIDTIERLARTAHADTLLAPEWAGGHFIHDLANVATAFVAKRLCKEKPTRFLEFPQYHLRMKVPCKIPPEKLQAILETFESGDKTKLKRAAEEVLHREVDPNTFDMSEVANYVLGEPFNVYQPEITDENIGMYHGRIHLTLSEIARKIKHKRIHASQESSIGRMLKRATSFGDFSTERLVRVPSDRDYSQRPTEEPLLYEIIPWRPHAEHSTLARLYKKLLEKEQNR